MQIFISTSNQNTFTYNGLTYVKNFMVIKQAATNISVHNAYDTRQQLLGSTHYSNVQVNGVVYNSQAALMSALAPLLFAKQFNYVVQDNNGTRLISIGDVTIDTNVITVEPAEWIINGIDFETTSDTVLTVPFAATGYTRIDILVGNSANQILSIQGNETTGIAVAPVTPLDSVYITQLVVNDNSINIPVPPITGSLYVQKEEFSDRIINSTGVIGITLNAESAAHRLFGGDVNTIVGFNGNTYFFNTAIYIGKEVKIANSQSNEVVLKHNEVGVDMPMIFPDGNDLTIQPNEVAIFKLAKTTALIAEFISLNRISVDNTDTYITGGTYSNGVTTLIDNYGGTISISGYSTGMTFSGVTNQLPKFTGSTINTSRFYDNGILGGGGYGEPASQIQFLRGANSWIYLERAQSNMNFILGNAGAGQPNIIQSTNSIDGFDIYSNGVLRLFGGTVSETGTQYEGLRITTGGTLNFPTVPLTGTTSDSLLVRDFSGNIKTLRVSAISSTDTYTTGGTYSNGICVFTNNSGGTFNVSGFSTGYTLTSSGITAALSFKPSSFSGNGTTNYIGKFSGNTLVNSTIYSDGTNIGIDTITPSSKLTVSTSGIISTTNEIGGFLLENPTIATGGSPIQHSPATIFSANGWKTTGSVNSNIKYKIQLEPVQAVGTIEARFNVMKNLDGAGWSNTGISCYTDRFGTTSLISLSSNLGNVTSSKLAINKPNGGDAGNILAASGVYSITSGISNAVGISPTINPTSGTHQVNGIGFEPIINQTGGANGVTRGLYINPTLTSALDFRAIEVINGSIVLPYTSKSATYTISTSDYLVDCTTGSFTVTLPSAVGCTGKIYVVKNSGTGTISLATTSSQTIDGVTSKSMSVQYSTFTLMSNGSNWIITSQI
jgi:hypothetical protein